MWKFLVFVSGRLRVVSRGARRPSETRARGGRRSERERFRKRGPLRPVARRTRRTRSLATRRRNSACGTSRRRVRPDVRDRLEWHKAQGHRVAIVSASPELYVRAIADELGADTFISTAPGGERRRSHWSVRRQELSRSGKGAQASRVGHAHRRHPLWNA